MNARTLTDSQPSSQSVSLVWATPNGEALIAEMARVSNPDNQKNPSYSRLIKYLIEHKHWSPFEMASACLEVNTSRDIGRQILRHRSFSFQEFSQRYQSTDKLPSMNLRECRMQDAENRQNSLPTDDIETQMWWIGAQRRLLNEAEYLYTAALGRGIAKEQARALLPEGITPSRMYMAGTIRSWMHYIQVRTSPETQKEHREIAFACRQILTPIFPSIMESI